MEQTGIVKTTSLVEFAIDIATVGKQTGLIQELLNKIMKGPTDENPNGIHFGKIPGCGPKPVLLQPGAQKICQTFQIHCETAERHQLDLPNGHREVRWRVLIKTNANGMVIGEGVGTCTTMEKKYRYRRGSDVTITDQEVPRGFWDLDRSDRYNEKGWKILGGKDRIVKKDPGRGNKWFIGIKGAAEPEEHGNPADYWNTIEKIGYKRAQMHAVINTTACSDIFEQDLEYLKDLMEADDIIDVSAANYEEQPKPDKSEQSNMDLKEKKDPPPATEKPATDVVEENPSQPAEEQKEEPAAEETPVVPEKSPNRKGPTNLAVSKAPKKPSGEEKATPEYASFIVECYQANIEQTITSEMLEKSVGATVAEGWSDKTVGKLMGVYAECSKNPDEQLKKYFPGHYD